MSILSKVVNALRFVGLKTTLQTIQYALYRDRLEASIRKDQVGDRQSLTAPGKLLGTRQTGDQFYFQFENYELEIQVLAGNLIRFTWQPGKLPADYALAEVDWPPTEIFLGHSESDFLLDTGQLQLQISQSGALLLCDHQGQTLRRELPPQLSRQGWVHEADLHTSEAIYGMGLRSAGLNLRGGTYRVWNSDPGGTYTRGDDPLYLGIPVYIGVSPAGSCLVFYENSFEGEFNFSDQVRVTFPDGALRYYLIAGSLPQILSTYTRLTGRPALPPRWSLGYHHSRWGYKNEQQIRAVVQKFKEHNLPLSAIHLDIDYMDEYRVFTVDPARFPDLSTLCIDLDQQKIRLITIIDPGVKVDPDYVVYQSGIRNNSFVKSPHGEPIKALVWPGWCVFPDFTDPGARNWWSAFYSDLTSQGVAGIWHDMNEPASYSAWGDPTLPKYSLHTLDGQPGDHREAHNLYGLMMNKAGYEGLKMAQPEKRPWLLTRSGWAGVQRYAWNWTADSDSSWEMLQQTIPALLNLTLSGLYFSGSDIGGFNGHPDRELYIRWFQLAALTPFFRLHYATSAPPREPWVYDLEVVAIIRQILFLRNQMMPYLYTLAYQAAEEGLPLIRPMVWTAPDDPQLYSVDDQFLLGDIVLVAPSLNPGVQSRSVWLPAGEWADFWTHQVYRGPGNITVQTNLEHIPLLIKCGHIFPLEEDNILNLLVFLPSTQGQSAQEKPDVLYTDDGDGYGAVRTDTFQLTMNDDGFLIIRSSNGVFQWPYLAINLNFIGRQITNILVDGVQVPVVDNTLSVTNFELIQGVTHEDLNDH